MDSDFKYGTWIESKGRLQLLLQSGELLTCRAEEIYKTAFSKASTVNGVLVKSPIEDLPKIVFSRFPAEPAVRASMVGGVIKVEVGVSASHEFVPVTGQIDQLVHRNHWFPIQVDALEALRTWVKNCAGIDGTTGNLATLIALRTKNERPGIFFDEAAQKASNLAEALPVEHNSIHGLNAKLYPYQAEGVGFLELIASQGLGCILADEMGLGKTLQVIALLQHQKNLGYSPSLIVAPATLLENWRRELKTFAPTLVAWIQSGPDRPGIASRLQVFDVVVVSYETAIRDEPLLTSIPWNVVALDEAQNIKNSGAQRSVVVKNFPRRVSIAVTGTPLENRLEDLWSITDFALPGLLGDITSFRNEYSEDVEDAARLGELIAPVILRRKVTEVAKDLPEKIEVPQPIAMPEELANAYEALRIETLNEFGPSGGLVATTKLRMFCAHPSLVIPWFDDPFESMPKLVRLFEILEEVFSAGERALVFSTYQSTADLLQKSLKQRHPNGFFKTIDGRVPVHERQTIIDNFFACNSYGALLLNPKAAGAGLNITAANHVIHFNPEWNPALTDQATARAYRRKQSRPVIVHHLYFAESVEEVIVNRAAFKRSLANEAVTGHEGEIEPMAIANALMISPLSVSTEVGK